MRKILTFVVFALLSLGVFTGCQKSEPTTTTYKMTVDIAGKATYFGNCFVNISYNPLGASNYVLEGVQDSADFPTVLIGMPYVATGIYNIGSSSTPFYAKYFSDTITTHIAASGILVISSTSPAVIGTYSFTCTDGTVLSKAIFIAKQVN